jgi:23S rRNA pseudouridine1911/1915/1917 synthase
MTVHPAAGTREDTLVHALLSHCGSSLSGIGGVARPGIVHRIDKETSGLLAVAKNDAAHQHLSAQLKDHSMARTYIAFAWSALNPREGTIDAPLARHARHRRQIAVVEGGRDAITHYTTEQVYRAPGSISALASKVVCKLETGRTHQIRVHLMHRKCPLLGDPVYGASTTTRLNRLKSGGMDVPDGVIAALHLLNRQALHAAELVLTHPKTDELMTFICPLPDDLQALETALAALTISA